MTKKRYWYIYNDDGTEMIRYNGNYLMDMEDATEKLNEQDAEIKRLEDELQNLQTFKKILEYAEKDMEERADWQAYCEKEFGGL